MSDKVELTREVVFTGGVAMNSGVVCAIQHKSGLRLLIPNEPKITGALGAAVTGVAKA